MTNGRDDIQRGRVANIRTLDQKIIDDALGMGAGYVLDFSDRTFANFFAEELNIDVGDPRCAQDGTSKARRLRSFLKQSDLASCIRVLNALWQYRQQRLAQGWRSEFPVGADGRFLELMRRLAQPQPNAPVTSYASAFQQPPVAFDRKRIESLQVQLIGLAALPPHSCGYAFEKFLAALFNAYGLDAKEPFRLRGEQIDGSFNLGSETYLLEAKWQNEATGVAELYTFHGKLEQKAAWTRGLLVSHTRFTEGGLEAFGKGKRVICMYGLDIHDALQRQLGATEAGFQQAASRRRDLRKKLEESKDRRNEVGALLERFSLLDRHYASDIERLRAIEEGGTLFGVLGSSSCPLCGAEPAHQRGTTSAWLPVLAPGTDGPRRLQQVR